MRPILCISDGRSGNILRELSTEDLNLNYLARSSLSRSGESLWHVAIFTDMQLFHANDKNLHVTRYRFNANNIWTLSDALSICSVVYPNLADLGRNVSAKCAFPPTLAYTRAYVQSCFRRHVTPRIISYATFIGFSNGRRVRRVERMLFSTLVSSSARKQHFLFI